MRKQTVGTQRQRIEVVTFVSVNCYIEAKMLWIAWRWHQTRHSASDQVPDMWVKNSLWPTSCSLRHPWICDEHLAPDFSICPHVFHCMPGRHWDLPTPPQTQFYSCDQWPKSYRIAHTRVGRHTTHILTGLMLLFNELVINRFYGHDYAIKDTRKWTVFSLDGHGYIRLD